MSKIGNRSSSCSMNRWKSDLQISFGWYSVVVIATVVFFIYKYYFDATVLPLIAISLILAYGLIFSVPPMTILMFSIAFNTGTSILGSSPVMIVLSVVALYVFFTRRKGVALYEIGIADIFLLYLLLRSVLDIVFVTSFSLFTFTLSLILLEYVVIQTETTSEIIRKSFLTYSVVLLLFGLMQIIDGKALYRWSPGGVVTQITGVYEPNFYALYLLVALVVFLEYYRDFRISSLLVILSSTFMIFLTRSNTGLIAMSSVYVSLIVTQVVKTISKLSIKGVLVLTLIGVCFLLFLLLFGEEMIIKISSSRLISSAIAYHSTGDLNTFLSNRPDLWYDYLHSLKTKDVGILAVGERFAEPMYTRTSLEGAKYKYSHNTWLDIISWIGFIGLILYIILIIKAITACSIAFERASWFAIFSPFIFTMTLSMLSERVLWIILFLILKRLAQYKRSVREGI
ncbi:O-antigen ligase family protein [Mesotoga sp. H07.pep.5.3]|uniref:O-antigen ligase family protein n=1 Tax=Mesotoga sp. H07.pep.5.3 TaxID=1421003 RepID=UPI000C1801A6|nr:O-antigen ligase family protein [Mesotoga sp. H07.pep.5.3]PIJ63021.1 hypothetical protein V513_02670 [Mesotoga sp. H07.pep.5.3]